MAAGEDLFTDVIIDQPRPCCARNLRPRGGRLHRQPVIAIGPRAIGLREPFELVNELLPADELCSEPLADLDRARPREPLDRRRHLLRCLQRRLNRRLRDTEPPGNLPLSMTIARQLQQSTPILELIELLANPSSNSQARFNRSIYHASTRPPPKGHSIDGIRSVYREVQGCSAALKIVLMSESN